MKKLLMFAVIGLFISTTAFAEIIVLQNGKTTTYRESKEGEGYKAIPVEKNTYARVLYDDVLISIPPQSNKMQIKRENQNIRISGANLRDVDVAGEKVSSNGHVILEVTPKTATSEMEIRLIKGDASVVKDGKTVALSPTKKTAPKKESKKKTAEKPAKTAEKPATAKPAAQTATAEAETFPEISEYVNEVAAQQTSQDVERPDLSQYAPI